MVYFFFKHGRHKKCEITCVKQFSKDSKQGGLEIPPRLIMSNAKKRMTDFMSEKLNYSLKSKEKSSVKPNSFSNEYLVYDKLCV